MLASDKLIHELNQQIGREMAASLQYVSIAAYFDAQALPQLARFFYRQSEEEREHAMKFVKFVIDVEGEVRVPAIPESKHTFASAEEAVALALESERQVTQQINGLMDVSREEKNYIAQQFLDWFMHEQLEEVATMGSLLQVVRRAGPEGLLHVEDYLARTGGAPLESSAAGITP
ncbi:MAG TPA: ferritin [Thermoanaerobaculia bacterium]|nr:ferritin [Thermoanaerobaculia bacterium]